MYVGPEPVTSASPIADGGCGGHGGGGGGGLGGSGLGGGGPGGGGSGGGGGGHTEGVTSVNAPLLPMLQSAVTVKLATAPHC